MLQSKWYSLLILLIVPLIGAYFAAIHPAPDHVYHQLSTWLLIHLLFPFVFVSLTASFFYLNRNVERLSAHMARWGAGIFLLFYVIFEVATGIGTGLVVLGGSKVPGLDSKSVDAVAQAYFFEMQYGPLSATAMIAGGGWIVALLATVVTVTQTKHAKPVLAIACLLAVTYTIAGIVVSDISYRTHVTDYPEWALPVIGGMFLLFFIAIGIAAMDSSAPREPLFILGLAILYTISHGGDIGMIAMLGFAAGMTWLAFAQANRKPVVTESKPMDA
ncbi:hypothetical protein ACFFK0_02855 [Paenibacillus chartarius]|uniref:Uncharacterized protein n=1 Tax=Paenibacillus chartarius TaxID=747481 RepID=A0ABV6DFI6_9BACL